MKPETFSNGTTAGRRGSDQAALAQRVRDAGLLARTRGRYVVKLGVDAVLLVLVASAVAVVGDSWMQLLLAVAVAVVFGQVGFAAHDAGHSQILRTRRNNHRLGRVLGGLVVGLSFSWWEAKHTRHHAHPNEVGLDPDVSSRAVVAWTPEQARSTTGLRRWVATHQALLFLPMLLFEGWNLHVKSARAVMRADHRARAQEGALLVSHFACSSALCSSSCRRSGRLPSSRSARRCSASTWVSPSLPTTRACRCPPPRAIGTTSAGRF